MKTAIIKYNAGNIRSVDFALRRMNVVAEITDDPDIISQADRVIFPGVGEAASTMRYLQEHGFDQLIMSLTQPVLGICLGQQLMCSWSEEGNTDCIGLFDLPVNRFPAEDKVPHMGWNQLENVSGELFRGVSPGEYVYFVHSYYVPVGAETIAETSYIYNFSAALHKHNFYATQFHPEKSGETGRKILENFLGL